MDFQHIEGNIELEIYNSTLDLIISWCNEINGVRLHYTMPTSGKYYLKVFGGTGGNKGNT